MPRGIANPRAGVDGRVLQRAEAEQPGSADGHDSEPEHVDGAGAAVHLAAQGVDAAGQVGNLHGQLRHHGVPRFRPDVDRHPRVRVQGTGGNDDRHEERQRDAREQRQHDAAEPAGGEGLDDPRRGETDATEPLHHLPGGAVPDL